ncbi:MAG: DUF6677 family protein [Planctomycetota bacterium]
MFSPKLYLLLLFNWFIPGLGYFFINLKKKGIIIFSMIMILYFVGFVMTDFRVIVFDFYENPFYYITKYFSLLFLLFNLILPIEVHHKIDWRFFNYGVFCFIAAHTLALLSGVKLRKYL